MTGSRKIAEVGTDLLKKVHNVKYRVAGKGKSPIGVLVVYQNRVEWIQNDETTPTLTILYSNVKIQRISQPNKDKVQLQICMNNEDQATFVFMKPGVTKEQLTHERDSIKETIQAALLRYRQINQAKTVKAAKSQNDALEAKKKLLLEDQRLQMLYRHLVSTKLITPKEFWDLNKIPQTSKDELGIPSGFLSSISQTEEGNGIRMNLTMDTIHAIFKTYPIVEKKHLELVPHAMTEQEFWAKFFQSHYFHKEKDMNEDPNDPFFECDKNDAKEINNEKNEARCNPILDLNYLLEDLGIVSEIRSTGNNKNDEDEEIDRLIKRCNYHSGRLLAALMGHEPSSTENADKMEVDEEKHVGYELNLESEDLAEMEHDSSFNNLNVNVKSNLYTVGPKEYPAEDSRRWKNKMMKLTEESTCTEEFEQEFFDGLLSRTSKSEVLQQKEDFFAGLKKQTIQELTTLYSVTWELLRHFWNCMPPVNDDMEKKLDQMNQTLSKFEQTFLTYSKDRIGEKHVSRLFFMLQKAKDKYTEYQKIKKSRGKNKMIFA
ncbi:unnamed protein product [Bursaphelenchus okinawaensis]|uniref:BSD domain-containing protein n=1 Tax=Bursaphelenchus okinawaensis TaxID=465554 RepID=A0A811KSM0_9BILA|nr:unnamed protein product [Bursaphelenchus okinawaensis]CAG9112649.1 unnamed protein product [Bursaphelenchus okinawaensis]